MNKLQEINFKYLILVLILFYFNFAVNLNYKTDNFFQQNFNSRDAIQGFFRSENYLELSGANVTISTAIWLQTGLSNIYNNPNSQSSINIEDFAVVIPILQNINLKFFSKIASFSIGQGFYESIYGYFYKPNYAIERVGKNFFNPWIDYSSFIFSLDPIEHFGFDLGFDSFGGVFSFDNTAIRYDADRGVGDYYFVSLRPSFGEKDGINFKAQLEYYGYFSNLSLPDSDEILNHLIFLGAKVEIPLVGETKLDIMGTTEFYDVSQADTTGSTVFGFYVKKPASFIERISLETKILYDRDGFQQYRPSDRRNSGIYADIWFFYKEFYSILFYQHDFERTDHIWTLHFGGRFAGIQPLTSKGKGSQNKGKSKNEKLEDKSKKTKKVKKNSTQKKPTTKPKPTPKKEESRSLNTTPTTSKTSTVDARRKRLEELRARFKNKKN